MTRSSYATSCIRSAMTCPMTTLLILLCAFLRSVEAFAPSTVDTSLNTVASTSGKKVKMIPHMEDRPHGDDDDNDNDSCFVEILLRHSPSSDSNSPLSLHAPYIMICAVLFAVPPRKPKHKIRRRSNHQNPISMAELAQHVSSQYINGPNGVAKEQASKERNRSSMGTEETSAYLKTLDRHPALVLNADYQVRIGD